MTQEEKLLQLHIEEDRIAFAKLDQRLAGLSARRRRGPRNRAGDSWDGVELQLVSLML